MQTTGIYSSPGYEYLAVVTGYTNLALYELHGEQLGEKLSEHSLFQLGRATWSDAGTTLAFAGSHGAAILNTRTGKKESLGIATAVAIYPDGSRVAVLHSNQLAIHHCDSMEVASTISLDNPRAYKSARVGSFTVSISPDCRQIAVGTEARTVRIFDAQNYKYSLDLRGHEDIITDLEWIGPDTITTSSNDRTIRIWDTSTGQLLRVLEAETSVIGISYLQASDWLVGWTDSEYFAWSGSTGQLLLREPLPVAAEIGYRLISPSNRSSLFARLEGPSINDIAFSHTWSAHYAQPPGSVSTYANAKILMLGDSGVGKSGLAMVLADEPFQPTESTHARRIWKMPVGEQDQGLAAQREVLLWDLAGQPGYRIIHQLHLSDGVVALILFDSRSETTPLAGIGYWARALRHAHATKSDLLPTFLVGARTDRGGVSVSDDRVAEIVTEFGFLGYLSTSAKEGWEVAELRQAVLAAIDWSRIPVVTSSTLFAAAKSFVLDQKAAGTLLTPLTSLLGSFLGAPVTGLAAEAAPGAKIGRDLLDAEPADDDMTRLRGMFEGCVARLESAGLVKRLAFGDLVLLQPELIDVYAGAIVNAARAEPDGLGSMLESRVLDVDFRLPEHERIADRQQEKLLVIATLEELIGHEIVLREVTEDGVQLVFPAAFRRDLPEPTEPVENVVEFTFEGPVVNIYVTLVVRLARSDRFTRRGAFQAAAQFEADSGGVCTVHLTGSDEGRGVLQAGYSDDVADVVRFQFERFVIAHLERRATAGSVRRVRLYRCAECGTRFSIEQVKAALSRGRTSLLCPVDEIRVALEDPFTAYSHGQDAVTEQMDASADAARSLAAASSVILGKEETTDFDVFLCHHGDDKEAVRQMARQLREHGILPWLDETDLIPGRPWQEELERQISHIRAAAVFVGPSGVGPWQNHEIWAFLSEFSDRKCPVIPVLLPEATAPKLPLFLRNMTWVDFSKPGGIERLIWGITGRKRGPSGLSQLLE